MTILDTITGKKFAFRTADKENISVLCPGYIITPTGEFVDIKNEEDHSSIFTDYLRKYPEDDGFAYMDTYRGARRLAELNHIIYLGVKTEDVHDLLTATNRTTDIGMIILPSDFEDISPIQAQSCLDLIQTNKSLFGNYEKINLSFYSNDNTNYTLNEQSDRETTLQLLKNKAQQEPYKK